MRFKSDPEALVLSTLTVGPQHGYGIIKAVHEGSGGLFKINEGQLYPLLHQMVQKGWIRGEWEPSASGPARKMYELREPGRKELRVRQDEWRRFSTAVEGLLAPRKAS